MIKNQKSHTTILKIHFSDLDIYNSRKNFPKVFCTNYSRNLCHSAICLLGEAKTSFQWCSAVPSHLSPPSSNRPITWKPKLKTVFQKSTTGFLNPLFRNKMKFKHNEMLLRNASKFFVIHFVQLCIFFFWKLFSTRLEKFLPRFWSLGPNQGAWTQAKYFSVLLPYEVIQIRKIHWILDSKFVFSHASFS